MRSYSIRITLKKKKNLCTMSVFFLEFLFGYVYTHGMGMVPAAREEQALLCQAKISLSSELFELRLLCMT